MSTVVKRWKIKELLEWMTSKFQSEGFSSPLLDAQLLLSSALKYKNRLELYINSENYVEENDLIALRTLTKRRLTHEPVAHILNQKYWYNLDLYIDHNVLIPRPETESLLDFILDTVEQKTIEPKIIFDLATGSGCLAIALAKKFPDSTVIGIDISEEALDVAAKNAIRNNVTNVVFQKVDLLNEQIYKNLSKEYKAANIIVSNPPYVTAEEWNTLATEVQGFEPKIALVANNEGLEIGKAIHSFVNQYNLLNQNSIFGMELAHQQPQKILENKALTTILMNAQEHDKPLNTEFVLKDLEEKERFLVKISIL